jgi:hypothetical protein
VVISEDQWGNEPPFPVRQHGESDDEVDTVWQNDQPDATPGPSTTYARGPAASRQATASNTIGGEQSETYRLDRFGNSDRFAESPEDGGDVDNFDDGDETEETA